VLLCGEGFIALKTLEKLKSGIHTTVVALGDSNTELTFHTRGRLNWVGLLAEAIFEIYGNGVCTMINSGKCASNFPDAYARLEQDVLRFDPDLVIIALGMNDSYGAAAHLGTFRQNVRQVVTAIQQNNNADVILCTPNPVVTVNGLPPPPEQQVPGKPWETAAHPVKLYAEALVELAGELDCAVVDHYALWCAETFSVTQPVADPNGLWMRMSDAIHPGPLGHLALYRALAPLLELPRRFSWE
jgi:acyl-CoA thioesterase I